MNPTQQNQNDKAAADAALAAELEETNENNSMNDPEQEIQDLLAQLQVAQDRYLRSQAELDNYRKRIQREQDEERKYREVSLISDLLPLIDNSQRAIAAAEKQVDAATLLTGFKMLVLQMNEILSRHNCTRIEALNQPFDPNLHQAIMQQPTADQPENIVVTVAQDGYKVHDRVIRAAHVVVSKKPE